MRNFEINIEAYSENLNIEQMKELIVLMAQESMVTMSVSLIEVKWEDKKNRKIEVEADYFEIE